jgi:uncharacterized protein (DUF433 family)
MPQTISNLIERRPSRTVGDRAYIAGTRISVEDVYVRHEMGGQSPDEIVQSLPHLSLAQVHAALSYAYGHLDEIRRQLKEGDAFVAQMRAVTGPGPLAEKLKGIGGATDEVSSG